MNTTKQNSPSILVAFAAQNDEQTLTTTHFGSTDLFILYQYDCLGHQRMRVIKNTTQEERYHNDPEKAASVKTLLREHGINVVVAKRFGPNIKRIQKFFVPVIIKSESVDEAIEKLQNNWQAIYKQSTNAPEQRTHILL